MKSAIFLFISFFWCTSINAQPINSSDYTPEVMPLNLDEKADAYSWLSKDGLRLYFSRDHSEDEIWMSERKSLNEDFRNPKTIAIDGITGGSEVFSCWLTEDEKTLFFVTRQNQYGFTTQLYKASFDSVNQSFVNPQKINLQREGITEFSSIFISAPSLTSDLMQLFVYYSGEGEHIAWFSSTDGINYVFKKFINDGDNYCPGNLSANGLEYYLSLRNESQVLVKFSRPNLDSDFGNPEYFKISLSTIEKKSYYQPSVNTALGIIALTCGQGTWESNDLVILGLPTEKINYEEKIANDKALEDSIVFDIAKRNFIEDELDTTLYQSEDLLIIAEQIYAFIDDTLYYVNCDNEELDKEDTKIENETITLIEEKINTQTPISKNTIKKNIFQGFPNPACTYFTIEFNLGEISNEKSTLEILTMSGQVIKKVILETSSGNYELNLDDYAQGLYYYRIYNSQLATENKKLVVKR